MIVNKFVFAAKLEALNSELKYELAEQEAGFQIVGHLECDVTVGCLIARRCRSFVVVSTSYVTCLFLNSNALIYNSMRRNFYVPQSETCQS